MELMKAGSVFWQVMSLVLVLGHQAGGFHSFRDFTEILLHICAGQIFKHSN